MFSMGLSCNQDDITTNTGSDLETKINKIYFSAFAGNYEEKKLKLTA